MENKEYTYKDCHYFEPDEKNFDGCPTSERYEKIDPICHDCPYKNWTKRPKL